MIAVGLDSHWFVGHQGVLECTVVQGEVYLYFYRFNFYER